MLSTYILPAGGLPKTISHTSVCNCPSRGKTLGLISTKILCGSGVGAAPEPNANLNKLVPWNPIVAP